MKQRPTRDVPEAGVIEELLGAVSRHGLGDGAGVKELALGGVENVALGGDRAAPLGGGVRRKRHLLSRLPLVLLELRGPRLPLGNLELLTGDEAIRARGYRLERRLRHNEKLPSIPRSHSLTILLANTNVCN